MIVTKEKYGCDADGNRGIYLRYAELEDSDYDWIYEQISSEYEPDRIYYMVFNEDSDGVEHEFEIDINEWLTKEDISNLRSLYEE